MTVVRPARDADLPALTAVYNAHVVGSHATFDTLPWSVAQRRAWAAQYAPTGPHRLLVAASPTGRVLGYATSSRYRAKPAYDASVETSVYLAPGAGGRGTGTALYGALLDALVAEGLHRAYAAVALPNDASLALHRRLGFSSVGTFSQAGWKLHRWVDVHWLERELAPDPDHPGGARPRA